MFTKSIDKIKEIFTLDNAKDGFATANNFALATTETFFTKGIDAVGKFQDSTDDKIRNGFKNSAKIQDKMFSFVEEKVAPRVQKLKSKKSKK
jgi:hypothetical protein